MIRMGVIGYGYWGPNVVRNFCRLPDCRVVAICDKDPRMIGRVTESFPGIELTGDARDIYASGDIDAVAIVTPVSTHYELTRKALENGKHVFVEKPFTATVAEAEELIELADSKSLKIMVDHTFLFTGAVRKIKELIDERVLGALYYYDSVRVDLGLFQHDVNVVWDLAPHDLANMDYLIGDAPAAVVAAGAAHVNGLEDMAYLTLYFSDNRIAHCNVNWLSPVKARTTLIGGEKKLLVWNDLEEDEKIKVYDKGVSLNSAGGRYDLLVSYRSGDIWAPKIAEREALRSEAEYFVKCVIDDEVPINDGRAGLRVVKMLVAADASLKQRGRLVTL